MLSYTVTPTNPSTAPVSLATCPSYTPSLYSDGKAVDSTLRLNCAGAGAQMLANASVSFAMQAQVPADVAVPSVKLSWKLQEGRGGGSMRCSEVVAAPGSRSAPGDAIRSAVSPPGSGSASRCGRSRRSRRWPGQAPGG